MSSLDYDGSDVKAAEVGRLMFSCCATCTNYCPRGLKEKHEGI